MGQLGFERCAGRRCALYHPFVPRLVHAIEIGDVGEEDFRTQQATPAAYLTLTDKEREVFAAVSRGLSNTEIAALVFAGESTVKTHVGAILRKLGLRDRVQIVVFAHEHGLTG